MKRKMLAVGMLLLSSFFMFSQSFLTPAAGYKTESLLSDYTSFSVYDFYGNHLYAGDGTHIYCFDVATETLLNTYNVPEGAGEYASFITVSPDGSALWVGFTTTYNVDDRIYFMDIESGTWTQKATLFSNFDMEIWNEHPLVSFVSDNNAAICLLDVSGNNQHRVIIEVSGYGAGLAQDASGNIYFATSIYGSTNYLYRWNHDDVATVVANADQAALTIAQADLLSSIPSGAYDCAVDAADNILFDFNEYGGTKVLAVWNNETGDAENYQVIASSTDDAVWLGLLKTTGNVLAGGAENQVITSSYGAPLASVYRENTSINENVDLQRSVNIYPNPSHSLLTIDADQEMQLLEIFNLMGQKIYQNDAVTTQQFVDVSCFTSGSYIVRIQCDNQIISKSFIKQ